MKQSPSVAIIIVNWNGREVTAACLESLKGLRYENYKIILVDNNSSDGSVSFFEKNYSDIELIALSENTGFTGGYNRGMRYALSNNFDYFLLLNNDTVITDFNFVSSMVKVLEHTDNAGMACPTIYYHQNPKEFWYAGAKLSLWRGWTHFHSPLKNSLPKKTGYATGCCLLVKKQTVNEIGLLNSSYFLSVEDVEWSQRAKNNGWNLLYIPGAAIYHKDGISSRAEGKGVYSPARIYYEWRNSIWFIREYANVIQKIAVWPIAYSAVYLFKAAAYLLLGRRKKLKAMTRGIKDGLLASSKKFKNN